MTDALAGRQSQEDSDSSDVDAATEEGSEPSDPPEGEARASAGDPAADSTPPLDESQPSDSSSDEGTPTEGNSQPPEPTGPIMETGDDFSPGAAGDDLGTSPEQETQASNEPAPDGTPPLDELQSSNSSSDEVPTPTEGNSQPPEPTGPITETGDDSAAGAAGDGTNVEGADTTDSNMETENSSDTDGDSSTEAGDTTMESTGDDTNEAGEADNTAANADEDDSDAESGTGTPASVIWPASDANGNVTLAVTISSSGQLVFAPDEGIQFFHTGISTDPPFVYLSEDQQTQMSADSDLKASGVGTVGMVAFGSLTPESGDAIGFVSRERVFAVSDGNSSYNIAGCQSTDGTWSGPYLLGRGKGLEVLEEREAGSTCVPANLEFQLA
ncbi:hypothetical protein C8R46DRAFT_1119884 [Mycena filopes]|nr:hypothetical protein C8R46DRAFT_1119884 [Mycena filopes]